MENQKVFIATDEAKGKAKQLRLFAFLAWIIAIGAEIYAILYLIKDSMLTWLIVAIVGMLILSIVGSALWKKANRLDPASEKNSTKFFIQNQLGAIMAVVAFLPMVILIFANKDASKKTKGIAGTIAAVALVIAGISGIDFNPPSVEKYTRQINEQTAVVEQLNDGVDHVYWTPSGNKLHIYSDCQHIRNSDISDGTVKEAWEQRKIGENEVCKTCMNRAAKEKQLDLDQILKTDEPEVAQQ
ncbi:MAG TPA: hypothetical protein VFF21_08370 [Flavobacteriaceae bacterium]|nr:hypothetical protein [Flavobacteriaceae bacterium]